MRAEIIVILSYNEFKERVSYLKGDLNAKLKVKQN